MPKKVVKPLSVAEANAIILASKLTSQPVPDVVEDLRSKMPKPPHKNKGKTPTPAQREALQKGMTALKEKREKLKAQKAERERKIAAGEELGSEDEAPVKPPPPPPVIYVKAPRPDKGVKRSVPIYATKEDFATFQSSVLETIKSSAAPAVEKIIEKPVEVEKIVDRIVEREKVLSGSEMLDRLFFNKT